MSGMKVCRAPKNVCHRSEGAAWAQVRAMQKRGKGLDFVARRCTGHWHALPSPAARRVRRITNALRSAS